MKESIFEDPLHYFCLIPAFTFFIFSLTPLHHLYPQLLFQTRNREPKLCL